MSNALTHLVVTPAIFYLVLGTPWRLPPLPWKRWPEGRLLTVGLFVSGYVAFSPGMGISGFAEPRFHTPVPFLFWAALRFGMLGASGATTRVLLKRNEFEPHLISLDDVVAEVLMLTRSDGIVRHVGIQFDLPLDLPSIRGDRILLQQVLLNLLMNGMDALETKTDGERMLTLRARVAGGEFVEVAVCDNGPGIPEDKLPRLFEPFFTTKPRGMGVGLPISRTIVETHGGRLWAENNPGERGATFRFTLPVAEEGRAARDGGSPAVKAG